MVVRVVVSDGRRTSTTLLSLYVLVGPLVSGYCVWDFAFAVARMEIGTSCRPAIATDGWASCSYYEVYRVIGWPDF